MQQQQDANKRQRVSVEKRDASYMQAIQQDPQESLKFNETLLRAYDLANQAEISTVVETIQMLYKNGNDALRRGLRRLTSSMAKKSTELSEKSRGVEEMTSKLHDMECESQSQIGLLQTACNDLQTRYDGLSDIISELETKAAITEQLQHDNSRLETHCHELRTQLQQKQRQLEDLTPKESALQNTSRIFSDHEDKRPLQYPMMQTNGLIVDHHRVISAWSKHGEDDDGYPYRNYICPVTKLRTSLARVNITLKIQEIATGLGMRLTPPIEFEYKGHEDSTWIKFGLMDQLSIVSKLCCMYNTGNQSSTIVLGNDQIYFNITLDKIKDSKYELKCSAQDKNIPEDLPVRTHIHRKEWNPFPNIAQYPQDN